MSEIERKLKALRYSINGDCYMGEEWELKTIDEVMLLEEQTRARHGGEVVGRQCTCGHHWKSTEIDDKCPSCNPSKPPSDN